MEYPQGLNRDANRIPTTGIGQTRNGMDEFINLVALYEYDKDTNLYFPPGILPNPSAPRVDIADQTVVSAIKAAATTAATLATEATVNAILDKLSAVGIDPTANGVSINGSIPEYQWLDTDTPPALESTARAFGIEINTTTHAMTTYYWTGTAWQEVA